jgi:PAS domain-containing protein
MPGPADQPLMRILRIALDLADCPAGLIGVRRDDRFQTIVSTGIPLADFQVDMARSDDIAQRLRDPCLIEDASQEPAFANHPYVTGSASWRFIASVPLTLTMLPYDLVLNCADPRIGAPRRPDLLARLEECAAIAADELRLISDIASQAESIAEVRATSAMREAGVAQAGVPMALIGADGRVKMMNRRLASMLAIAEDAGLGQTLADLFPLDGDLLTQRLQNVLDDGQPANSMVARLRGRNKTCVIDMIRVVSADSSQPVVLCTITDRTRTFALAEQLSVPEGDSPQVVSEFLLNTLIPQKRLLRRGPVPYHALYRWRSSIKDSQLAALKAIKRQPSEFFVATVADQLAAAATALYGQRTMQAVVAVPCGNSGPNCLANRLAAAVGERLALPHITAFADLPRTGGSHPRGNLRRPPMQLLEPVDRPVLLIDDVATSGVHLAEAAQALKTAGAPAVLPLVWLADA